jgi:hypothetical protein
MCRPGSSAYVERSAASVRGGSSADVDADELADTAVT